MSKTVLKSILWWKFLFLLLLLARLGQAQNDDAGKQNCLNIYTETNETSLSSQFFQILATLYFKQLEHIEREHPVSPTSRAFATFQPNLIMVYPDAVRKRMESRGAFSAKSTRVFVLNLKDQSNFSF